MASVTILGSNNQQISLSFDPPANFALAQQLAEQINASVADGKLITASDLNGPPPALPPGTDGAYFQSTLKFVALPPGYTTDIVDVPGSAVVLGGADPTIMSGEATNLTFIDPSGSGTVVAGGANR